LARPHAPEVVVFAGPTIRPREVAEILGARAKVLPPVAQGDLYRVAQTNPIAVAIVDGYFDRVPSVWHKEILWAMSAGVHAFGAASMGALRAAELTMFGMVGFGDIYQAFYRGEMEDDDEVAIAHADEGDDYRPASEALVNVRFTMAAARTAGLIDEQTRIALIAIAKGLFYPERSYPKILALATEAGLAPGGIRQLRDWLPAGRVDQKRMDATGMMVALRDFLDQGPARKQVAYQFEHTDAWEGARQHFQRGSRPGEASASNAELLEELKLAGNFPQALEGALLRLLALEEGRRLGKTMAGSALSAALESFRRDRGLLHPAQFDQWAEEQGLAESEALLSFMRKQGIVQWIQSVFADDAGNHVADWLRARGDLDRLLSRAEHKVTVLRTAALEAPELADSGLTRGQLLEWHFRQLGRDVPADVDLAAIQLGFASKEELLGAVLREYLYLRLEAR
jgi:hypothetical protein